MARPRYVLTTSFYNQSENFQAKSSSGTSLSGRMYMEGEELEWDGKPDWFMTPVNAEAAAMVQKYPPVDPMTIDDMIDRMPSTKDAKDNNLRDRADSYSNMDMQATTSNADLTAKRRRGRPPKHVEV